MSLRAIDLETTDMDRALSAWRKILSPQQVLDTSDTMKRFGMCTTGLERKVLATLVPHSAEQISEMVKVARQHKIPLSPVSSGKNWGYNSALPAGHGCVILDLSQLKRIVEFDINTGTLTVEPGVTQAMLYEFLEKAGVPYMVPTTGAGPECSLIGNALERGYGITPHCDHFSGLLSLEAVLPDGTIYRSPLSKWRKDFKWGIGPYMDGLFTQGRAGIVTRATFALARKPENVVAFMCPHVSDDRFEEVVDCVRELRQTLGANLGGINLMNARRILSMTEPPPNNGKVLPPEEAQALAKSRGVGDWTLTGGFYGEPEVQKVAARVAAKHLRRVGVRAFLVHKKRAKQLGTLGQVLKPFSARAHEWCQVRAQKLNELLDILGGKPSEVALALSYWRSGQRVQGQRPHPSRDGCGLVWYSPLVPIDGTTARQYVENVERLCLEHNLDPLVTLTTIGENLFDSTIPLLFDLQNSSEKRQVEEAYRALFRANAELGCVPYRIPYRFLDLMQEIDPGWQHLNALIDEALDPDHLFSPGRYIVR